jgi:osmoprotectant transport system substrate-binding protein/osmoprotectant transport system permease protein
MRRVGAWLLALVMLCLPNSARAETIRIGSKLFTESRVLAEIMAQLIEARTDLTVERRFGLGGTQICFGALQTKDIDLYPEYTGTAWSVMLAQKSSVRDPLRAFLLTDRKLRDQFQVEWLSPFGFNNSYALALQGKTARRLGATRVSDLLPHAGDLKAGVSHEFLQRDDGYPGLSKAYGLELADIKGMEHGLAYEALRTGAVDVVDTFTTDGKLMRYDVVVLEDDRKFFPPYDGAPLARSDVMRSHPELVALFAELGFRIDDARMRGLNHQAEASSGDFASVARAFLQKEGLVEVSAAGPAAPPSKTKGGFLAFMWNHRSATLGFLLQHLFLTVVAVLLAVLFAVPLGIGLTRRERLAGPVLGFTGVLQTIPGLALLAFMIPVPGLGLGARSAIAALFLYALLPIVRNTYTGIKGVDPDLLEAARGIGLTPRQILLRVELPLAVRTIMAGIRTATVISIGVATLAAFVGAGGLGDPIVTGLQLDDIHMILSGAVPAALLAMLVDAGLAQTERLLTPRGLRA